MRTAGLTDPLYHQTSGSVGVTLSTALADRKLDADLPAESQVVVGALREAERLSTGELAEILRMSRPPVIRRLAELEKAGIIEWVGKSPRDPRAYWRLSR
jgi:ATP-dependent DNA helicase RecG